MEDAQARGDAEEEAAAIEPPVTETADLVTEQQHGDHEEVRPSSTAPAAKQRRPNYRELSSTSSSSDEETIWQIINAVCSCAGRGLCVYCRRLRGCVCEGAGTCRLCLSERKGGSGAEQPELPLATAITATTVMSRRSKDDDDDDCITISDDDSVTSTALASSAGLSTTELFLLTGESRTLAVAPRDRIFTPTGRPRRPRGARRANTIGRPSTSPLSSPGSASGNCSSSSRSHPFESATPSSRGPPVSDLPLPPVHPVAVRRNILSELSTAEEEDSSSFTNERLRSPPSPSAASLPKHSRVHLHPPLVRGNLTPAGAVGGRFSMDRGSNLVNSEQVTVRKKTRDQLPDTTDMQNGVNPAEKYYQQLHNAGMAGNGEDGEVEEIQYPAIDQMYEQVTPVPARDLPSGHVPVRLRGRHRRAAQSDWRRGTSQHEAATAQCYDITSEEDISSYGSRSPSVDGTNGCVRGRQASRFSSSPLQHRFLRGQRPAATGLVRGLVGSSSRPASSQNNVLVRGHIGQPLGRPYSCRTVSAMIRTRGRPSAVVSTRTSTPGQSFRSKSYSGLPRGRVSRPLSWGTADDDVYRVPVVGRNHVSEADGHCDPPPGANFIQLPRSGEATAGTWGEYAVTESYPPAGVRHRPRGVAPRGRMDYASGHTFRSSGCSPRAARILGRGRIDYAAAESFRGGGGGYSPGTARIPGRGRTDYAAADSFPRNGDSPRAARTPGRGRRELTDGQVVNTLIPGYQGYPQPM